MNKFLKKAVVGFSVAAGVVTGGVLIAPNVAFADSVACNEDHNFRLCMFKDPDGYSSYVCNKNTNGVGTPIHLVLRTKTAPYAFTPVTADKTLYGTSDSTTSCMSVKAKVPFDNDVKFSAASTPGSIQIYVGVQDTLS